MAKVILEIFEGNQVQQAEFEGAKRLMIGRIKSAEIHVDHPDLANVHALLEIDESERVIKIVDVSGSALGTVVNGNKVSEYVLARADRVQVGPIVFSIYFESVGAKAKPSGLVTIQQPTQGQGGAPLPSPPPVTPKKVPPPPPVKSKSERASMVPPPPPSRPAKEISIGEDTVITIAAPIARSTTSGDVVEITQMLGSEILDVVTFSEGQDVTIGETLEAHFTLPLPGMPQKGPFVFVKKQGNILELSCDPQRMSGALRLGGKLFSLNQALRDGILKSGGAFGYIAHLTGQDYAKIQLGEVTFFIAQVPRPPVPKPATMIDFDPVFNRVVAVVSFFWIIFTLIVGFTPVDTDIVAERAADKVFQRILIRRDLKIPTHIVQRFNIEAPSTKRGTMMGQGGGNEGEGVKAAGAEGKRGRTDLPPDKKGVTAQKRQHRKVVSPLQQGLLGAITTSDVGAKLTTLVSKGGTLEKSLQGVGGGSLESGGGTGGQGLRGSGLGGGGTSATISGLGTKGRGGGQTGYGEGAVLGKGVSGVLGIGDEVFIEGQLTKEEIRRVVLAHQNELIGCYQLELSRSPGMRGAIHFSWIINADGSVTNAKVKSAAWRDKQGSMGAGTINQCMLAKLQTWQFPNPRGGGVVIVSEYPFNFSPGN